MRSARCCSGPVKIPRAKVCSTRRSVSSMRIAIGFRDTRSIRRIPASRTFEEVAGYDEMIVLRDIEFESFCEHHMAPIIGRAHIGYLPTE